MVQALDPIGILEGLGAPGVLGAEAPSMGPVLVTELTTRLLILLARTMLMLPVTLSAVVRVTPVVGVVDLVPVVASGVLLFMCTIGDRVPRIVPVVVVLFAHPSDDTDNCRSNSMMKC